MKCLNSILGINFMCLGISVVIASTGRPLASVSECIDILQNVFEDEKKVRASFHVLAEKLSQKAPPTCEFPVKYLSEKITNCAEWQKTGNQKSGVYTIYPKSSPNGKHMDVYCDMETEGGGWIVIQRRAEYLGRQIDFTRKWDEYKKGFGNLSEEFWLGNDNINLLTAQEEVELRVDLKDFEGTSRYAEYDTMIVMDESWNYFLLLGNYSGDAGDGLALHNKTEFYTHDKVDNNNCAIKYKGGWWYNSCHHANLNGVYMRGKYSGAMGVTWYPWHGDSYSLKHTEMKIRPRRLHNKT